MLKIFMFIPVAMLATTSLASAQARGSYQESCDNIQQRGPFLSAECQDVNGETRRTSLDLRGCQGGVSNNNGRLTCARNGGFNRENGDGGYGEPRRRYYAPAPDQGEEDSD